MTSPPVPAAADPARLPTLRRALLWRMSVLLVGLAAGVVIIFGLGVREVGRYQAQRQAIQLVDRAQSRFESRLVQLERLGSILAGLWADGHFDPAGGSLPDSVLVQAGSLQALSGLIVARADGQTAILYRNGDYWSIQRLSPVGEGRSRSWVEDLEPGHEPLNTAGEVIPWDARERPWYRRVQESTGPAWTEVYTTYGGGFSCVTYSVPVRDGSGRLLGVVALDYLVQGMVEMLGDPLPTPHSEAIFLDRSGKVLAATAGQGRQPADRNGALPQLPDPRFPTFSLAYRQLAGGGAVHRTEVIRASSHMLVLALENRWAKGLGWTTMVAIPLDDLAPSAWPGALAHLGVLLAFFGLAVWQITRISGKVVGPLSDLARRAENPTAAEESMQPRSGIREFRLLEESVHRGWEQQMERQRLREQLLHLERVHLAGTLTSGIAHDLGNLLSAAQLSLDLAEEESSGLDAAAARRLESARHALERGARLVGSLLEFCRSVRSENRAVDLGRMLLQVQPLLQALLGRRVALRIEARPCLVLGSAIQIEQVLVNLVLNARDAVEGSGTVEVRVQPARDRAELVVEDDGTGIPPEVLPRVFEAFFTTKPAGRGTGLGLAMALHIAQEHGGTLVARNRPGGGAVFTLSLPLAPDHAAAVPDPEREAELRPDGVPG